MPAGKAELHGQVLDETNLHSSLSLCKGVPAQALMRLRPELHSKPCVVMKGEPPLQHVWLPHTKGVFSA